MCDLVYDPSWDRCRELVLEEIERCKADLAPLVRGELRVGESFQGNEWHDVTPALIAAHKRNLGALQAILEAIR